MKKRGQVSIEFVATVGFAFLMIVPLTILFYEHTTESYDEVNANQAGILAQKIADTADPVYFLGHPSSVTFKANVPDNVKSIRMQGREIIMNMTGGSEVVGLSRINLTGNLTAGSGIRYIRITALDDRVNVSYER
jgi:hypothetical protein